MDSATHIESPTRMMRVFAYLAVLSLLTAILGPMMDHHFSDRQPGHAHIYPGGVAVDHEHDLTAEHGHAESASVVSPNTPQVVAVSGSGTPLTFKQFAIGDTSALGYTIPIGVVRDFVLPPQLAPLQVTIAPEPDPPRA